MPLLPWRLLPAVAPVLSVVPAAAPVWSLPVVPAAAPVWSLPVVAAPVLAPLLAALFWSVLPAPVELPLGALFCAINICGGVVWLPELVVSGGVVVEGDELVPGVVLLPEVPVVPLAPVLPVAPVEPVP